MNGEELARYEHFKLIRENSSYRIYLALEELQAQSEAPLAPYEAQPVPVQLLQPEWGKRQWDVVLQVKAEVVGWREKHAEMMLKLDKLLADKPF